MATLDALGMTTCMVLSRRPLGITICSASSRNQLGITIYMAAFICMAPSRSQLGITICMATRSPGYTRGGRACDHFGARFSSLNAAVPLATEFQRAKPYITCVRGGIRREDVSKTGNNNKRGETRGSQGLGVQRRKLKYVGRGSTGVQPVLSRGQPGLSICEFLFRFA